MQHIHTVSKRWENGNPFIKPEEKKPLDKSEMTEGAKKYFEKVEREKLERQEQQRTKVFVSRPVPQVPERLTPLYVQEPRDNIKVSEQEKHSLVSLAILLNDEGKRIYHRKSLERYSWKNETTLWNNSRLQITHRYAIKKLLDLLDINYKGQWKSATLYNNLWKKKPMLHFKDGICVTPDNKALYKHTPEGDEILWAWELHFSEEIIFTIPRELLVNHISENKKYKKLQNKIYG
ncbi:MAG: hypothetical protein AABY15_02530 [Nanoarchaeota archaeon]